MGHAPVVETPIAIECSRRYAVTHRQVAGALVNPQNAFAGFINERRQHRRSHLLLVHPERKLRTVVPMQPWRLALRHRESHYIRQSGMTEEEFKALL
jgi:predicted RNA binding protein YcfA (HicA-like mRNA interferase family)